MSPAHAASGTISLPWGNGDTYTLLIAIGVFLFGCWFHRGAIKAKGFESEDLIGGLMASGLTFGPLALIVVDPIIKFLHVGHLDLLVIVMTEARITLWFAAFLALLNTTLGLLRPRVV